MNLSTTPRSITQKQIDYIKDLMDSRNLFADPRWFDSVNAMDSGEYDAHIQRVKDGLPEYSMEQGSRMITKLKELPKAADAFSQLNSSKGREDFDRERFGPQGEPDAGMYKAANGDILRIYLGQQSGKMLAKKLVDTGRPHPEDPSITLHEYEYLGKATRFIGGAERLSLEEAKEYGRMSGTCCRCARRLDVPESVEAGIGPVCAGKVGEWA